MAHEPEMMEVGREPSITSQHGLAAYPASIGARTASDRHSAAHYDEGDPFADPAVAGTAAGAGVAAAAAPAPGTAGGPPAAPKKKFYLRPWFILTLVVGQVLGLVILFLLLYPVVHGIADRVLDVATLDIESAIVRNPTNTSFELTLISNIFHTGHIPATLYFQQPVHIFWVQGALADLNETETKVGTVSLQPIHASGLARVNQTITFNIEDEELFGEFTQALITQDEFTWRLKTESIRVNALKFPVVRGLSMNTDVKVPGINSFLNNVKLTNFLLPGDAPNGGGIEFSATTELDNPSPFDIQLGDVGFNLTYDGVYLGTGTSTDTSLLSKAEGPTSVTLNGTLVPHTGDADALEKLGYLFSRYISSLSTPVAAQGLYTRQSGTGETISWLTKGVQALNLTVPLLPPQPINPIRSIDIGYLNLSFVGADANEWAPITSSSNVTAELVLPFGFSVNISHIQNSFTIYQNNTPLANLSTPDGAASSNIQTYSSNNISGPVFITINNSSLTVLPDQHAGFEQYTRGLTVDATSDFQLVGFAQAVTELSIGTLTLNPIDFNVSTSLQGLNSLNTKPTTINSVDVVGGTSDYIAIDITVSMYNPANLNLAVGDLYLDLFNNGSAVGTTLLPNLLLVEGTNTLSVSSNFTPNANAEGVATLNQFLNGIDTPLTISGFSGSTQLESLLLAFESLSVNTTLPGLATKIINSTKLEVLPTTGWVNNISDVTVSIENPFTAAFSVLSVNSTVSAFGITLGTVFQTTNFNNPGKSTTSSPTLQLNQNLDPEALFTVTRVLATLAGEDTEQLDGIMQIGGYSYITAVNTTTNATIPTRKRSITASDAEEDTVFGVPGDYELLALEPSLGAGAKMGKRDNIYTGFNLPSFTDKAFAYLTSDLELVSDIDIGGYVTTLTYTQKGVPVATDSSLNLLLPYLAHPIVQKLVDQSDLGFNTVLISNAQQESFDVSLTGSITNAGPFDAVISFPLGLEVHWEGNKLGSLSMPNVSLTGDVGATLDVSASFAVSDVDSLTAFSKVLITNETFEWTIVGQNLSVSALGIDVPTINYNKTVSLKGLNGLKNGVVIDSFDLPANDPAGGITLTLQTTVTNPSQVGVSLSEIGFVNYFHTTYIGPAGSASAFTLNPLGNTNLPLTGRLVPQNGSAQGLTDMGTIFTNYVHGVESNLTVNGDSANGANGPTWLIAGIKTLSIPVLLPAPSNLQVIQSITLEDLELNFTQSNGWTPSSATRSTLAKFYLPFAFPIDVTALTSDIVLSSGGVDIAHLPLGTIATTTDVSARIIDLTFSGIPLTSYGDKHSQFASFLEATTDTAEQTIGLYGKATAQTNIAIGQVTISDIAYDVKTNIAGLQGLKARPTNVSNLDVYHGYSSYLQINTDATIYNPSNISIGTGTVAFGVGFQNEVIGSAIITDAYIVPGSAEYPTQVRYEPSGGAATASGTVLLENYISGIDTTIAIEGQKSTTNIASLQPALESIALSAVIPAINATLITQTNIEFPPDVANTKKATTTFGLANPFTASINLNTVVANATYNTGSATLLVATINDKFSSPISASGHSTITSPSIAIGFNTDPLTIIELLYAQATINKVDLGPLIELFGIVIANPNYKTTVISKADSTVKCSSGQQFDVDGAILAALKNLYINLDVTSSLHLDDYGVTLSFAQNHVPAITDSTALYLIGAVAPPIVQTLVNNASLTFSQANISSITNNGFALSLAGSLLNAGPLDAYISFPVPLTVQFDGTDIATITIPPICYAANTGVPDLQTSGSLTITNQNGFTSFAEYLLHNPSFTWTIHSNNVTVSALGFDFLDVQLSKQVTFEGLNGLPGVTISNFQLPGDDSTPGLLYSVDSLIPSPSNLGLDLGTVAFQAYYDSVDLGPISGNNLDLLPLSTTSEPLSGHIEQPSSGNEQTVGNLFSNYISGINATLQVKGDYVEPDGKTKVTWLSTAFETLTLSVVLPGMKESLVGSANIEFPANIATNGGIAQANFVLDNPFGVTITLESLIANATHNGLYLGVINQAHLSPEFVATGYKNTTSPYYPLDFDIDPVHIIQVLAQLAAETNTDLGPLPELFEIVLSNPNFHPPITATPLNSTSDGCSSGQQFDVDGAILNTLKGLTATLDVTSTVKLDDITVPLHFTQTGVPANTDYTALYLITVVAPPIVQTLVNNATLTFSEANITNVNDDGFDLALSGQLLNTGPLDALIEFLDPVTVTWDGQKIATIKLADSLCAAANSGIPNLQTTGTLTITDQSSFTSFAEYLLHNSNFTWTISSSTVRVTALNIQFDGVSLSKDVSLLGFNNLPGVTISNFNLPSDDPAGGITISTDSMIPSPSNLGITLGTVGFIAYYNNVELGPLTADGLVLLPLATVTEHLSGRLIPQSSSSDLAVIGDLFSRYLAGDNTTLTVKGDYVDGAQSSPVTWLSTAFKTLSLSVILPGHVYQIIYSLNLLDLELVMDQASETWAPLASTEDTVATFKNPFGFSLTPLTTAANITLGLSGVAVATLDVPSQNVNSETSTGNLASLELTFKNVPLTAVNDQYFAAMLAAVTDGPGIEPELDGTVALTAKTAIGNVPISGIPFNVTTAIAGIEQFDGKATISNVSITGSGGNGAYILAPLTATLTNPSNISLLTNDAELAVYYKDVYVGRTVLTSFDLLPGTHDYPAEFRYEPTNANDSTAQDILTQYLQSTAAIPITAKGDAQSSPYASLIPAFEGVSLSSSLTGIGARLVTQINVFITLDTLTDNTVTLNFDAYNPLDAELNIEFIQNDSGLNGQIYAHFDQAFSSFVVPPKGTANSGNFQAILTQGAIATLPIIAAGELDIANAITSSVGGGYTVPWLQYTESSVPTSYTLDLLGLSSTIPSVISSIIHEATSLSGASTQSQSSTASVASVSILSVGSVLSADTTTSQSSSTTKSSTSDAAPSTTTTSSPVAGPATTSSTTAAPSSSTT
ncbi:hypothetical protein DL93DRAFT_2167525 [Clavulina sp. PMI_390]|nr:hypothetical protein DL93DRAFT_2167525 [Clavulina sp. PMI_390]